MLRRNVGTSVLLFICLGVGLGCRDSSSPPDDGVVRGLVLRVYSGDPIVGAAVSVGDHDVTTGADGRFHLPQVVQGSTTITIHAAEYRELARVIEVGEYQTLEFMLTPLDTLIDISGRVYHRIDGPLRVRLDLPDGSHWTDIDGRWSASDIPLGPVEVVVEHPPYNRFEEQLIVHADGQYFEQVLTRNEGITVAVEHDAYVCTRDDSLNANRGDAASLQVTGELGRVAVFRTDRPTGEYAGAEVAEAWLELTGRLRVDMDAATMKAVPVTVTVGKLIGSFSENSVDFFTLPPRTPIRSVQLELEHSPVDQAISVDITDVFLAIGGGGAYLAVEEGQPSMIVNSSENWGVAQASRPHVRFVLRY